MSIDPNIIACVVEATMFSTGIYGHLWLAKRNAKEVITENPIPVEASSLKSFYHRITSEIEGSCFSKVNRLSMYFINKAVRNETGVSRKDLSSIIKSEEV
jgi:hypothetical protein